MRDPLPVAEIRRILGDKGFLRLYGQDTFLFVSDIPRRVSVDALRRILHTLDEHGFKTQIDSSALLLIDMTPKRWEALLVSLQAVEDMPVPHNEELHDVYTLARLLSRHSSAFSQQPMELIRAVLKQYGCVDGMIALAPQLIKRCAEKLRCSEPLPSVLARVLFAWLQEYS